MNDQPQSGTAGDAWPVAAPMPHDSTDVPPAAPGDVAPLGEVGQLGEVAPSAWAPPTAARPDSSMTVRIENLDLSHVAWPDAATSGDSPPAPEQAPVIPPPAPAPTPAPTPAAARPELASPPDPAWAPPNATQIVPPAALAPSAPHGTAIVASPAAGVASPVLRDTERIVAWTPPPEPAAPPPPWAPASPEPAGDHRWSPAAPSEPAWSAQGAGVRTSWNPPASVSETAPPVWDPPADAFATPAGSELGLATPAAPKRRRGKGVLIGAVLGVGVLAGGGLFAARSLGGGEEANTPQAAVQSMLDAVTKEDFLAVLESLSPAERDVFIDSGVPMIEELKRLGVFDDKLNLNKVAGVKVSLTNVKFTTEELRDDLMGVRITGGAYALSGNPAELPLGSFVKSISGSDALPDKDSQSTGDLRVNTPIVVLKDGKRWYVSLQYSIAQSLQERSGRSVPAKGAGVAANGAATAEEAVRDMMNAAADLDVRRMIELLPPDELAAVHDYSGAFIDDAVKGVKEVRGQYDLTFPKIELEVESKGNTAFVTIRDIEINGKLTGPDAPNSSASFAKNCLSITVDGDTKKRCGRDIVKFIEDFGGQPVDTSQLDAIGAKKGKTPKTGIVAVKRDGRWYVSPLRTMLDDLTNAMKVIDRKDLDELRQQATDITNGMTGATVDNSNLSDSTFDPNTDTTIP